MNERMRDGLLEQLQRQLRRNTLNKLTELQLLAFEEDFRSDRGGEDLGLKMLFLQSLFCSVVTVVGLTNLHTCQLEGFPGEPLTLVTLLPTSLQHLTLCSVYAYGASFEASHFTKFPNLQTLSLKHDDFCFFANAELPCLERLDLHGGTLCAEDWPIRLVLPKLTSSIVHVCLDSGWEHDIDEDFLVHQTSVRLVFEEGSEDKSITELTVPSSSKLQQLAVSVPSRRHLMFHMHKAGVQVQSFGQNPDSSVTVNICHERV